MLNNQGITIAITKEQIQIIQKNILTRYKENKRPLPRRTTQNPYAIHISEVMSQQTQVERVIPYREKRMQNIPNYEALAKIPKLELLSYWSGLGFNSRALRLQECAKIITKKHQWELPQEKNKLLELPWIWPYTASAICAFARNQDEIVIDTNIRRVLIFLLQLDENISLKDLEKITEKILPKWQSRDWHNALMDYGATHLTAKKTKIKSLGKQSKFEGSDRQVRWRIIKQLVENNALSFTEIQQEFPQKSTPTLKKIISQMIEEKLVHQEQEIIKIN